MNSDQHSDSAGNVSDTQPTKGLTLQSWLTKDEYEKQAAEDRLLLPILSHRVKIASIVLGAAVLLLVLFASTPIGSLLPTFGGSASTRSVPSSPVVGLVLLAAVIAYIVIVNDVLKRAKIVGGKQGVILTTLAILSIVIVANPVCGLILFFLVYCNILGCVAT